MILFEKGTQVYLCINNIDFRKGIMSLHNYSITTLQIDYRKDRSYIVFINRKRNVAKVLFYRDNKTFLLEARLDGDRASKYPVLSHDLRNDEEGNAIESISLSRKELADIFNAGGGRLTYT